MRKLKMATEYVTATLRAAFLGILMSTLVFAPLVAMQGCNAAQVQADIAAVLKDLPTAISIAEAIVSILGVAGVNATQGVADITNWSGQIAGDLKLSSGLISQYQTNLAKAPAGVIGELDTAVATINTNLQSILNASHVYDAKVQAAIGVAVAGIDSVLLGLEAIIPPAAASQFPRVAAALSIRGRTLGAITATVPTPRHLALLHNAGVGKNFPTAVVPVPHLHFLGIPV
jgi:hypothetical protein